MAVAAGRVDSVVVVAGSTTGSREVFGSTFEQRRFVGERDVV